MPSKGVGMTQVVVMQGPKRGKTHSLKIQMGDVVVYMFPKEKYDVHQTHQKQTQHYMVSYEPLQGLNLP